MAQGSGQGLDPYAYVAGNPETYIDPSGQVITDNDLYVAGSYGRINYDIGDPDPSKIANGIIAAAAFILGLLHRLAAGRTCTGIRCFTNTFRKDSEKQDLKKGSLSGDPFVGNEDRPDKSPSTSAVGGDVRKPPAPPVAGPPGTPDGGGDPSLDGLGTLKNQILQVTQDGIDQITRHLSTTPGLQQDDGSMYPYQVAEISRLQAAFDAGRGISGGDASFYTHEIFESNLMDQGVDYDTAHNAAIDEYGVSRFSIYPPEVIQEWFQYFNGNWLKFWGFPKPGN